MRHAAVYLVLFSLLVGVVALRSAPAKAPQEKVLRHLVLYKFKDDQSPAKVQEVIDTFAGMAKQIDTVVSLEHGPNVSKEGKSDGLTYGFCVTFKDDAGLATYLKHPAHEAYVSVVKDRREKVIVFDYWAEK
jgi:Stress responsive A/B Barrel Domain